jgi:Zn-dependent protease
MIDVGRSVRILTLFGFPVRLHASWLLILLLVTWSLASVWFPQRLPGLIPLDYWLLGLVGALGLFASILVHELSHALVARARGLPMGGITLFLFGGVAEMEGEPESPETEFLVAGVGPVTSVVIALFCWGVARIQGVPVRAVAVLDYLGVINVVLAGFNLVPAFPLDGGRVFRAVLWKATGSLRRATRTASAWGRFFGTALIVLGVLTIVSGGLIGGMWFALIGLFLRAAADAGYRQVLLEGWLGGEPVRRFQTTELITVPADLDLLALLDDYVYRHYHKAYPVVGDGVVEGIVTTDDLRRFPREHWGHTSVREAMTELDASNTIDPDADAMAALKRMVSTGQSRLLVVGRDRVEGLLTVRDLMEFLALKTALATHEELDDEPTRE